MEQKERVDIDTTKTSLTGIAGAFETLIRKFRTLLHILFLIPVYMVGVICMGIALTPALYFVNFVSASTQTWCQFSHTLTLAFSCVIGFYIFGFSLLFVVPVINFCLPTRIKPWRGIYYSVAAIPWYLHNALTYIPRYLFLEFVTPTPFNLMFYRLMGMKIGKGAQINTVNISDPRLIEMEDKATLGGSVTIACHYASGGFLIIAPVRIRKGATVGLRAIILGDVEIGERARVLPNSAVMPKTRIPAGEIWGGVPAQFIAKAGQDSPEKAQAGAETTAKPEGTPTNPDNKA